MSPASPEGKKEWFISVPAQRTILGAAVDNGMGERRYPFPTVSSVAVQTVFISRRTHSHTKAVQLSPPKQSQFHGGQIFVRVQLGSP